MESFSTWSHGWLLSLSVVFFLFFFFFNLFIYLFLAVLGPRFCARAFSSCGKRGPPLIAVRGPLTIAAPLVAEHKLQMHKLQMRRLSSCGPRTQPLLGMWDPPRPGPEPVSPALAGRLSTTAPPGKPKRSVFEVHPWHSMCQRFLPFYCTIAFHWMYSYSLIFKFFKRTQLLNVTDEHSSIHLTSICWKLNVAEVNKNVKVIKTVQSSRKQTNKQSYNSERIKGYFEIWIRLC